MRHPSVTLVPFRGTDSDILAWLVADLAESGYVPEVAHALALPDRACSKQREQCHAGRLLAEVRHCPDEYCLGITHRDLYAPGLNYVFGVADMPGRAAVIGLQRLRTNDPGWFRRRALIEAVHELGHARGLWHCPRPHCVMHFSNSLRDTDQKSPFYCERCARLLDNGG